MMKYIEFLKSLSWVAYTERGGTISEISITPMGVEFSRAISNYLRKTEDFGKHWAELEPMEMRN